MEVSLFTTISGKEQILICRNCCTIKCLKPIKMERNVFIKAQRLGLILLRRKIKQLSDVTFIMLN